MASSATLRHINKARVLDVLREQGIATRVELAALLGLQRSTLTVITAALIEDGLVRELTDAAEPGRSAGRPAVSVALAGAGAYFAGLDLGNEVSSAIVVDLAGVEVGRASVATDAASGPDAAEAVLIGLLEEAIAGDAAIRARLQGIGVTVSGVVVDGVVEWAPILGWRDSPFGQCVGAAFGVPVILDNDANAAALSEAQFGAGRNVRDLIYVLLDRGVGVGVVIDRAVHRGSLGLVGEAGHIRVPAFGADPTGWPTIEELVGLDALRTAYASAGGAAETFDGLVAALAAGEPAAEAATRPWAEALVWLTSTLTWMLAPELVVFGGRASAVLEADGLAAIAARLEGPQRRTRLAVSAFGADAIVRGAAALPMSEFFALPALRPEQSPPSTARPAM